MNCLSFVCIFSDHFVSVMSGIRTTNLRCKRATLRSLVLSDWQPVLRLPQTYFACWGLCSVPSERAKLNNTFGCACACTCTPFPMPGNCCVYINLCQNDRFRHAA